MAWTQDPRWDLESIFPGRPDSPEARAAIAAIDEEFADLVVRADALGDPAADPAWDTVIPALLEAEDRASELASWVHAWGSTHADDPAGHRAIAAISAAMTRMERAWTRPNDAVARASDDSYAALLARPALRDEAAMFEDMRPVGHLLLPPAEQALFTELSEDGMHAWSRSYERISGELRVVVGDERISSAQALNRLEDPDAGKRAAVFDGVLQAWGGVAESCADALTHIIGTRAVLNRRLGVDELAVPLAGSRIERGTLDAIFALCAQSRDVLQPFLRAKATRLGKAQLDWSDLRAPLGHADRRISYEAAQDVCVDQFGRFSQDMAEFARHAFAHQWVEAEDRAGKRPGAYCTGLPISRQSRVFMTYGGGLNSVLTLAHELGHAYHNHALLDTHPARRRVPMTLAETASTFGEALVRGAALDSASSADEQLDILDKDLSDAVAFLHNIPVRFHFERACYAMRAEGALEPARLSDTMEQLQREWYGPVLGKAHPLFWADKLHFYLSTAPFYNYPYTFGYLFSSLVYAHAREHGPAWAGGYLSLLRDTGAGPAEKVASAHLGIDLRTVEAWTPVLDVLAERVNRFVKLCG